MDLEKKIIELEDKIRILEKNPHRCEVCGKPTDGWVRYFFWTHWYCSDHHPMS